MRKTAFLTVLLMIAPALAGGNVFAGGNGPKGGKGSGGVCTLDPTEIADLIHMREEEKLARDVYVALYEWYRDSAHNPTIFSNIAESERNHMDALGDMIATYADACGLADPVDPENIGHFENVELACLFDLLVGVGRSSFDQALWVGATIEDLDIVDLNLALANTDNEDLQTVYLNLTKGSRNHMRSFYDSSLTDVYAYDNVYMCDSLFEAIVGTPAEHVRYGIDDLDDPNSGLDAYYFEGWVECVENEPWALSWCPVDDSGI